MCGIAVWFNDTINNINWVAIVNAIASLATTGIAFLALRNWKQQDKAKREAEFIDTLVETTHAFFIEAQTPIMYFEITKKGIDTHVPTKDKNGDFQNYLELSAKHMREMLAPVQPLAIKLNFLAVKGQVFKFMDYAKCRNAIKILTQQFSIMQTFTTIIETPTWYWENTAVNNFVEEVKAIKPDDIRKSIDENNVVVLEFTRETYKRIYG